MDLKSIPKHELIAELERREEEKRLEEEQVEIKYIALLQKHKESLMELIEHTRTSCSDKDPYNEGESQKCDLIYVIVNGHWWDKKYRVVLEQD